MAWIYFRESEDSPSHYPLGLDQSPTVKTSDTHKLSFCLGCGTVGLEPLPFGTMCEPCAVLDSGGSLTSYTEDSHARTSALQAMEKAWQESEADYSLRSHASLAKYDHASSSWKMCLPFGPVGPTLSADDWPASGMIVGGECFPLSTWERRTSESAGGSSPTVPTATATDDKSSRNATVKNRSASGNSGVTLTDYVTLFPTPAASSSGTNQGGGAGRIGPIRPSLETMARRNLWPTPRASDGEKGGPNQSQKGKPSLAAMAFWETPTAGGHDSNLEAYRERMARKTDPKSRGKTEPTNLSMQVGGQLNPVWVEWLMGYEIAWTVCADWAMQWFRPKREKRLKD